jgi:tetratricopeptide (TPR) repeat protein
VPWAKMGLAVALRDRGALDEAGHLAEQVTQEAPEYLSAYDFLASVHEAQGNLRLAQQALQRAADASPLNTVRQRLVGDTAARNKDLLAAEKAYGKVIERNRGSSLRTVDDFANLSRVLVERGDVAASRKITADMKREWRGDKQAELASLITESLCLDAEGSPEKAAHSWSGRRCSYKRIGQRRSKRKRQARSHIGWRSISPMPATPPENRLKPRKSCARWRRKIMKIRI